MGDKGETVQQSEKPVVDGKNFVKMNVLQQRTTTIVIMSNSGNRVQPSLLCAEERLPSFPV